jgi:hypothetical protein
MQFFSLRAIFLVGFIIAMPVLALPTVARRIDEWLYGAAPADFGRPPVPPPLTAEPIAPVARLPVAPARFDEPSPAPQSYVQQASATGSYEPAIRTPLPTSAPFMPPNQVAPPAASPTEPQIDERTIARLQQIRQRLEELGAEYVLVDTQDSGRFRFHCRMIVDARLRATRSFEGASFDPVAAGEQVLVEVERWRTAPATIPATPVSGPVGVGP